jgi:hypothetical protein
MLLVVIVKTDQERLEIFEGMENLRKEVDRNNKRPSTIIRRDY